MIGTIIAFGITVELVLIVLQIIRGQMSHFNVGTVFDAAVYYGMGGFIVAVWIANLILGIVLAVRRLPDRGIAAGMRKINVATPLTAVFTAAVRETLVEHPDLVDSRKYLAPAREAFAAEVARLLALFAGETDAPAAGETDAPAARESASPADGARTAARTQESEA